MINISINVSSCEQCPYYKESRYGYCSKMYGSDSEAYTSGSLYVEYDSDIPYLIKHCPFKKNEENNATN